MASSVQAPSQGHAQGKKPPGRPATARYLSSTSASSSRAVSATTPSASSSRLKPTPTAKVPRPALQTTASGTSTLKASRSAGHVPGGSAPVRSAAVKASSSVSKNIAPSSSSSSLPKKTSSQDKHPAIVDVTRDPASVLMTLDALQQAGQIQAWLFMSATLESSYEAAERAATAALEQRRAELSVEEADMADARVRFEAERLIAFYEELMAPQVPRSLPEARIIGIDGPELDILCNCILSAAVPCT
ncbi:hypothetical protein EVJ58_g1486 [Rhodofomes roseus]|uniref:Uncharacterized protein n=1 Tax=Rhodofomes roseus TaxID=34475 RepID=A0A4Y9YZ43_9APHY|nr:hypothetical protein EVJ58_g1486 [Rhodofomes roseus]